MSIITILEIAGGPASPIDSIAKNVNPQADIHNVYWWISLVIIIVAGIVFFIVKHYFKGLILDGKPHPEIRILDGNGKMKDFVKLGKTEDIDIDAQLAQKLKEKMAKLDEKYPEVCADPFQNMNLVFKENFNSATNYNADVKDYKYGMRVYYNRIIKNELMSQFLKEVKFVLYAKGKKACDNLKIDVTISGRGVQIYSSSSKVIKKDKHDEAPDLNQLDRSSKWYAFFPNEQEEYEYTEWNLIPQSLKNIYTCQSIVSGCLETDVIPIIYVDTRHHQEILIDWKINGIDIPEKGEEGQLVIRVE